MRCSVGQRLEHLILMVTFTLLVITGLPPRMSLVPGAAAVVSALGGIDAVRLLHRRWAVVFSIGSAYHLGYMALDPLLHRGASHA